VLPLRCRQDDSKGSPKYRSRISSPRGHQGWKRSLGAGAEISNCRRVKIFHCLQWGTLCTQHCCDRRTVQRTGIPDRVNPLLCLDKTLCRFAYRVWLRVEARRNCMSGSLFHLLLFTGSFGGRSAAFSWTGSFHRTVNFRWLQVSFFWTKSWLRKAVTGKNFTVEKFEINAPWQLIGNNSKHQGNTASFQKGEAATFSRVLPGYAQQEQIILAKGWELHEARNACKIYTEQMFACQPQQCILPASDFWASDSVLAEVFSASIAFLSPFPSAAWKYMATLSSLTQ